MRKKLDQMGRLVIPKKVREKYGIEPELTELELIDEDGYLIIRKVPDQLCICCKKREGEIEFNNLYFCKRCIKDLVNKIIENGNM